MAATAIVGLVAMISSSSPRMPQEPPPSSFVFPEVSASSADARGKVVIGGDLEPGTLLAAYRSGLFPMRQGDGQLAWWSPDPRGILTPDRLRVSRSLHQSQTRFETRVDTAFTAVLEACADRAEGEYLWITPEVRAAFGHLHQLGWAHSVETWTIPSAGESAALVGGLYGVTIGGFFSGESMFHYRPDASKVALVALIDLLRDDGQHGAGRVIDIQWLTPHLASLGAVEVSRVDYLACLRHALSLPLPTAFGR